MNNMSKPFQAFYQRILEVTESKTQIELADFLGIRQSSISDAIRREHIPSGWILAIFERKGVLPSWLKTGEGSKYVSEKSFQTVCQKEYIGQAVAKAVKQLSPEFIQQITERTIEILEKKDEHR